MINKITVSNPAIRLQRDLTDPVVVEAIWRDARETVRQEADQRLRRELLNIFRRKVS